MAAGGSWWTCSGAQAACLSADAHAIFKDWVAALGCADAQAVCLSADASATLEGWVAALGCADQLSFMS